MRISGPVLGTSDPIGLAEFYERFLGWPIVEREGEGPGEEPWAKVRSEELGLKMEFQYEPHFTPPVWPPVPGEQQMLIHLDIGVPDLAEGVAFAVGAGAREAEHQPQDDVRVMLDPAGHVFCLFDDPLQR
jgi:catechol 2,3-dioxygenase-like lactoylglutathione lyase family enzyme